MSKATGDSGKGGESGDEGNKGNVDLKALADTVVGLVDAVKAVNENQAGVTETMKNIQERLENPRPPVSKEPESKKGFGDMNLEAMDRMAFADAILSQVGSIVTDALKPLTGRIEEVGTESTKTAVAAMVVDARKVHPDIDEWVEEVRAEMEASPGLNLQKALTLVKAGNPEKATEMKEKFGEAGSGDVGVRGNDLNRFGGLPPGGSQTEPSTRMSNDDAADAAWDSVLSTLDDPSILTGDGN